MIDKHQDNIRRIRNSINSLNASLPDLDVPEDISNLESQIEYEERLLKTSKEMKDSDHSWLVRDLRGAYENRLGKIQKIWESGTHETKNPPQYYIEWALGKGIEICWYEWAKSSGRLPSHKNDNVRVSTKTENAYLDIILALSEALIGEDLSEKPYADAAKIERALSKKHVQMPCTMETLGKYLKKAME